MIYNKHSERQRPPARNLFEAQEFQRNLRRTRAAIEGTVTMSECHEHGQSKPWVEVSGKAGEITVKLTLICCNKLASKLHEKIKSEFPKVKIVF